MSTSKIPIVIIKFIYLILLIFFLLVITFSNKIAGITFTIYFFILFSTFFLIESQVKNVYKKLLYKFLSSLTIIVLLLFFSSWELTLYAGGIILFLWYLYVYAETQKGKYQPYPDKFRFYFFWKVPVGGLEAHPISNPKTWELNKRDELHIKHDTKPK